MYGHKPKNIDVSDGKDRQSDEGAKVTKERESDRGNESKRADNTHRAGGPADMLGRL